MPLSELPRRLEQLLLRSVPEWELQEPLLFVAERADVLEEFLAVL